MLVRQEKSRAVMELMTWCDLQFWYIIRVDQVCELSFYLEPKKQKRWSVFFFSFLIQDGLGPWCYIKYPSSPVSYQW